jgi:enamine deaminase RidA (YjgF/YER057c/UK114 family)
MNREKYASIQQSLGWKTTPVDFTTKPYSGVRVHGNFAFVSGSLAYSGGELLYRGRIGETVSVDDAKKSAALSVINCLDLIDQSIGLEKVEAVLKLTGYLSCSEEIGEHPVIMNAGSEVLIDIFGEAGKHARAALGIHTLPFGGSVEVEMVVSLKE